MLHHILDIPFIPAFLFLPFLITLLISTAVSVAIGVARAMIGPKPIFGAELKNKTVSSSAYGHPWPRCRGAVRLNGNMIWSTVIHDTVHKTTSGGIFGVGQQAVYTHTYSVSVAIGFGKKLQRIGASGRDPLFGSAVQFVRIYADGKILYNARVTDAVGGATVPATMGSGQPVSSGQWPEGDFTFPVTGGGNGLKLNLGDVITFQWFMGDGNLAPSGQSYEVQAPLNLASGQSGTVTVFPPLGPDPRSPDDNHSVILVHIPGINGPLFAPSSFDPDPHDGSHLNGGYIPHTGGIRFYLGTDGQDPDPLMVARLGAGQVPGYRGLVYCLIYDLQLSDYGNRIPNFSAEIQFDAAEVPLSEIVAALMTEAGYSPAQYDVSALALTTVQGIELDPEAYKDSLHKLMALYLFDSAEIDGQIIFKFRDGLPAMEIPFEDIGALADMTGQEPRIEETLQDEQQVPETVWLRHYDPDKQFQQASQYARRISQPYASDLLDKIPVANTRLQMTLDVPISEHGQVMRQQAEKILFDLWSSRFHASLKLPPKYIQLDPTDIIEIPYQNDFLVVRLAQVDRGASWPLELSGVSHDYHHSVALSDSGLGGNPPPIPPDVPPSTTLTLMDMPFLEDADAHNTTEDTGIYFALSTIINVGAFFDSTSFQWHGGTVYRSADNVTFDQVGQSREPAFRATALNLLPAPTNPWVFDDSQTLTVTWVGYDGLTKTGPSDRPTSAGDDLVTNGHANVAALIKSNGEIELLQFGTVVDHDDGTFTFSHLVRGIRGTETMAGGHAVGDVFVLLIGSAGSSTGSFSIAQNQPTSGPQVQISNVDTGHDVTLNWAANPPEDSVASYNIKRGTALIGPFTQIGTSLTNSYIDTSAPVQAEGDTLYYEVTAINSAGESLPSLVVSALIPVTVSSTWLATHDAGTPGTATGSSSLVASPSIDGQAVQFIASWTNYGGVRFSTHLAGNDSASQTFTFDAQVQVGSLAHVHCLEFDLNQVLTNGDTVIFGTQANFDVGFWQFTTKVAGNAHWNTSNIPCSRSDWTPSVFHHLVITYHRSPLGVVTYDSVSFDGTLTAFSGASGASNFSLGWTPVGLRVVNFQVDGDNTSNSLTAYIDQLSAIGT